MMYPRLKLLSELLKADGTIFVSINDIEVIGLRHIMNEIFGRDSFLAQFVWKSRQNKDNRNTSGVSVDHEYVICYGSKLKGGKRIDEQYSNPDGDPRGDWTSGNMVGLATREARPNLHYDLINPETGINYGCPEQGWRYGPQRMNRLIEEKRILWPPTPEGRPREKVFLSQLSSDPNISSLIGEGIFTRSGTVEVERIFGERIFNFPKPISLIRELILQGCPENGIVLDSFAGSGTTAHAVLDANNQDGGVRKFILVECEEYANKITAERVRRVINGYPYSGKLIQELLREAITWTKFRKCSEILQQIDFIETTESTRFDAIKKSVEDGDLIVVGEKKVSDTVEGIGGDFTFCTLGEPIDFDRMLTGESLPSFEALGAALFHTATNCPFDASKMETNPLDLDGIGYLGASESIHVWLIYKPELDFLKSRDAALTLAKAEAIAAKAADGRHLVFAPARFVSQKMLNEAGIPVEFAPLPFALYRIERGSQS
jgi:adenine-specific DNA-methyltransferase